MKKIIILLFITWLLLSCSVPNLTSVKQINPNAQVSLNWQMSFPDHSNRQNVIYRNNKTIDEVIDVLCIHSSSTCQNSLYSVGLPASAVAHKENLEVITTIVQARTQDIKGSTICRVLIGYDYQVVKTSGVETYRLYLKYIPNEKMSFTRDSYVTEESWNIMNEEAYKLKLRGDENERKFK